MRQISHILIFENRTSFSAKNRIQAVAYRGEALDSLAVLLDLSILQLSKYNDLLAGESIPLGSPVYRQPKKKKGVEETVVVRADDNMWLISQWQEFG